MPNTRPSWWPIPGGGVNVQTTGLYVSRLATEGFIALEFDASYQGESTGQTLASANPFKVWQFLGRLAD